MAEHLTLVALRRALSARAGVSEKVADDFLNALTGSIQDGLQKEGKVTVNGLGTFAIQDVPARESVNVANGERFTIDGYKKVVFTAGNTKQSAASNQRSEDIDPLQKLGEQAEEIKDILGELSAMSTEPTEPTEPTEAPVIPIIPEAPVIPDIQEAPASPEQPESPEQPTATPKAPDKPFNPWLTGLITIGVFAMLLVIAYFVLRHQIVNWAEGMRSTIEQRVSTDEQVPSAEFTEPTEAPATPEAAEAPETPENSETSAAPEIQEVPAAPSNPWLDDSQRKFTEFQRDEIVGQDSRLAWIAKKRYGEKAYWVFIYEVNRDRLKSPDRVMPGMQLRVPKLPKELRNPNDPETKALLDRLSEQYLK